MALVRGERAAFGVLVQQHIARAVEYPRAGIW